MANPIIVAGIPKMTDADLIAAYQRTDGTGISTDVLRGKIERRNPGI